MLHHGIGPLGRFAGSDVEAGQENPGQIAEPSGIAEVDRPHSLKPLLQMPKLCHAHRGLKVRKLEIVSDAVVHVVPARAAHRPPLIFQLAEPSAEAVVVGQNGAALPGRDRLVGREREAAGSP